MTQRCRKMADYIRAKQAFVSLAELSEIFPDVSTMTIRRDLKKLEQENLVLCVKGGARSVAAIHASYHYNVEDAFSKRATEHVSQKIEIAEKTLPLLLGVHSLYIDAGTTALLLAERLPKKDLFFCTNAPNVALELMKGSSCRISLVGGTLNRENICVAGPASVDFIEKLNVEVAVLVASGFSDTAGFTCGDANECMLKQKIIARTPKVIILMDASKVGTQMPFTFAEPHEVDTFVSDAGLPANVAARLMDRGVKVM